MSARELGVSSFPMALSTVASLSLAVGFACAVVLLVDVIRRPPRMRIMAVVWPLTALFGGVLCVVVYFRWARTPAGDGERARPAIASMVISTTHCGAGCALADLLVEWLAFTFPAVAIAGGLGTLFPDRIFAIWVLDLVVAFVIGVAFQYAAIAPARGLGVRAGIAAAIQADAASISAWQLGMYGAMAIIQLAVLPTVFGGRASVATPEFWFAMQLAMLAGFMVALPVNAILIRAGIKEAM